MNAYYGIGDQVVVLTVQAGARFIHGSRETLNFNKQDMEGFVNAYGEHASAFGCKKLRMWCLR